MTNNQHKIYELRKDVLMPGQYFRAGEMKTLWEWERAFGPILDPDIREWFFDVEEAKKFVPEPHLKIAVINEVFQAAGLNSFAYKNAAHDCIDEYLKRVNEQLVNIRAQKHPKAPKSTQK